MPQTAHSDFLEAPTRALARTLVCLLVSCCVLAGPSAARGDDGEMDLWRQRHRLDVGLYAGVLFPARAHELYDRQAWQEPFDVAAFDGGLRLGYMPWPFIGVELEGGVMPTQTRAGGDGALLYTVRAHVIGQYPARFAPFLVVGYGLLGVNSSEAAVGTDVDGAFHAGLGLKVHATNRLTVRLDGRAVISGQSGPGGVMPHFEALLGASYMLWHSLTPPPPDADGDGVPDERDRCPRQAAKTRDGCPPPDGDGDGDGVPDSRDKCPKKPAQTKDGCPPKDSDGDGVPDSRDKCPKKPAQTKDGCPVKDSDGDSIPDDSDKCPQQAETKNGYQDADGCPDTVPRKARPLSGDFPVVHFSHGKAEPWRRDLPKYRKVLKALRADPTLRLLLRGHADEAGEPDYNMALSRRRALAVRRYLVYQGIERSRMEIEALGETEPRHTSGSRKARAANRRVEFKIISQSN